MKVVIVGGGAGGATAAARLRRLDEDAEIIIIERTGYVSYANCGLPYYVGGVIQDRSKLTLQTPESFKERFEVDVRVHQEVVSIGCESKVLLVRRLDDGSEYIEHYEKLVLSPGAKATVPPIYGTDSERLFVLRTVEDTFAITDFIEREHPKRAVVVGAGFIGLEVAENLVERGIDVTVLQRGNHALPILDSDMAAILHNLVRDAGVNLILGADVQGFIEGYAGAAHSGIAALIAEHNPVQADMAVLAVGVTPESDLARTAGLELGLRESIKVDEHMRTSDPNIYAVGDAVEVQNVVTGSPALIALAGPANKQGRIAADNICGIPSTLKGSQGSSVMKMFTSTVAATGLTLSAACAAGLDCDAVVLAPANHATYYPGSSAMTLKVVYERTSGRILGAQALGREGVEKRIDVIAVAIRAHMTAHDLTELDLSYAPPYSSAKDPVNMAGYMIENILQGLVCQVTWDDVIAAGLAPAGGAQRVATNNASAAQACRQTDCQSMSGAATKNVDGVPMAPYITNESSHKTATNGANMARMGSDNSPVLLDVRTAGEYARGHVEGALHIPLDELRGHLCELPHDREIWVHCQSGLRSYIACRILSQNGFSCANVAGGYGFYSQVALDQSVRTEGIGYCGMAAD